MAARDDDSENARLVARRRQRAAGDISARLANTLMKMSAPALAKLELDEDVRESIDRARAVTSLIARRRAERTLAGELRRVDLVELEDRMTTAATTSTTDVQRLHLAESWRAKMIEGGLAAAAEFPGGTAEPLPQLIERAQRERTTGKPPGAARALFRHLMATLTAKS
jgi:ribosome-associated protein